MKTDAPEIVALRAKVRAAQEELDFALRCHEAWKPAAYDKELHERIGHSLAAHTFVLVRVALRREMLLALLRLWDTDKRSVNMHGIANSLRDKRIIDALAGEPATPGIQTSPTSNQIKRAVGETLRQQATAAIEIIGKYEKGGSGYASFTRLWALRNERLAHRQIGPTPIDDSVQDTVDEEIEILYQDASQLITLLSHVVERTGYAPQDFADVYAAYTAYFWAGVRSEQKEGHPNYKPPFGGLAKPG